MTSEETKPSPTPAISGFGLALAVLGGVCGAILTEVLSGLDQSGPRKWAGLALGAALPPVIAALPQGKRQIQVIAAILLSVAAFVLAYFGQFAFTTATGQEPNLPTPDQLGSFVDPVDPGDGLHTTGRYGEGNLKMAWAPQSVQCNNEGFCDEVVVTSEGVEPLSITRLEVLGAGGDFLQATGCVGIPLSQNESCTITLIFDNESAPTSVSAVLVVHQNFVGPATEVPVQAHGEGGASPECTVPDVVGETREAAVMAITAANLVVSETSESSSVDPGLVLAADPAAGDQVECDSTVTIVVSADQDPD